MSDHSAKPAIESLLRELAPQVLGAVIRRFGDFDVCEDAGQEALLAVATQWPVQGVPERPRGVDHVDIVHRPAGQAADRLLQ